MDALTFGHYLQETQEVITAQGGIMVILSADYPARGHLPMGMMWAFAMPSGIFEIQFAWFPEASPRNVMELTALAMTWFAEQATGIVVCDDDDRKLFHRLAEYNICWNVGHVSPCGATPDGVTIFQTREVPQYVN